MLCVTGVKRLNLSYIYEKHKKLNEKEINVKGPGVMCQVSPVNCHI